MAPPPGQLTWLADTLPTSNSPEVTEKILGAFFERLDEFHGELQRIGEREFKQIVPLSRETPTHYKWHMFTAPDRSFTLWLHEYKPYTTRSSGYAQSIHNHRYPMSALVLTGGYYCTKYEVRKYNDDDHVDVRATDGWELTGGSTYSLRERDFHSVTKIKDGTVSLLIQGQPSRPYSISVDAGTHRASYHTPIEGRLENLRSSLTTAHRGLHHAKG